MQEAYLARFGLMYHVGRFRARSSGLCRGQIVVLSTTRGVELGQILAPATIGEGSSAPLWDVLRPASRDDRELADRASLRKSDEWLSCSRFFEEESWPIELIDVEPLLEFRRTVLYYIGSDAFDRDVLLGRLRSRLDLDAVLEPVGIMAAAQTSGDENQSPSCSSCGEGCRSKARNERTSPDSVDSHCGTCAIKDLLKGRMGEVCPVPS